MSDREKELERLARLRERQLDARDPHAKARRTHGHMASRAQAHGPKKVSFSDIFTNIPHKWRGIAIGAVIGIVVWIILSLVASGSWVDIVGGLAIFILALAGFFIGQAFDARDELRDLVE